MYETKKLSLEMHKWFIERNMALGLDYSKVTLNSMNSMVIESEIERRIFVPLDANRD